MAKKKKTATKKKTVAKKRTVTQKKTVAKKKTVPQKRAVAKKKNTLRTRKTIADWKVFWKGVSFLDIMRWLILVPMAMMAYFFAFMARGYRFSAMVIVGIMAVITFYNVAHLLKNKFPKTVRVVRRIFTTCLVIGLIVCGITECIVISASFGDPDKHCDYMVVLGAKVRDDGPSVSLQNRIDGAYEYMVAHPDVIAVVSGGQGDDEPMPEAQCMFEELVAMGIDADRIWMEDKATSTWENMNFTLDLIQEKTGTRPDTLGVLSSEYHLFRASLFADACGVEFVGIPAQTTIISQKINHFMREVAGVWHYIILGGQYDA